MNKEKQNLGLLVESVSAFFQPAIHSKGVLLFVDASAGTESNVNADRNLLETLLLILLSNALDAVLPGGEIRVFCREAAAGRTGFAVKDNGCGIKEADRKHVFEPFFTTKDPGRGTGLGLAIARNVVFEHGGTIEIESQPGAGTTVYVDLPAADVQPQTRGAIS